MTLLDDPVIAADLAAYVDDQLDPHRRIAVAAHLARNPILAAEVMGDLRLRDELRLALALTEPRATPATTQAARRLARAMGQDRLMRRLGRIAAVTALFGLGWLAHNGLGPLSVGVINASEPPPAFVEAALSAHTTSRLRIGMESQPEVPDFDPAEIRAATGIVLPEVPAGWTVQDVQVFPSPQGPSVEMSLDAGSLGAVSLFAVRPGRFTVLQPQAALRSGATVAWFQIGEVAHVLVSTGAASAELEAGAELLARTLY